MAGTLAVALGVMACRVGVPTQQKPGDATDSSAEPALLDMERRLHEIGERLRHLIQADAEAYDSVLRAYRLPKDDSSRPAAISTSLRQATAVPLETATYSSEVASLLSVLLLKTKPAVASDLKVGLSLAAAAIEGGLENAGTNIKALKNHSVADDLSKKIADLKERLVQLKSL